MTTGTVKWFNVATRAAVRATITRYGDDAGLHAAQRADELMAEGDMDGRAAWHRIENAIDELGRTAPGKGEDVH